MFYVLLYVTLRNVHSSSIAIILMGKRELVVLLNWSSWCLLMVEWLILAVPWGCLRFVIVVFPDHTHLLFLLLCWHEFCDVNVTLSKSMKSGFSMYGRRGFHAIGQCACRLTYPLKQGLCISLLGKLKDTASFRVPCIFSTDILSHTILNKNRNFTLLK